MKKVTLLLLWLLLNMPCIYGTSLDEPAYFTNCPVLSIHLLHDQDFYYDFDATDPYGDLPYNFMIFAGPGTAGEHTGIWIFDPDISEAGEVFAMTIGVATASHPYDYILCEFTLEIESACGDVNGDMKLNILDVVRLINYFYKGADPPVHFYHADVNPDGNLNILDATRIIDYLYKTGELNCRNIKDDFPLTKGYYWKYDRYLTGSDIYDTVLVTVSDYNELTYIYSDSSVEKNVDIINEMVYVGNYTPMEFVYDFPMRVNNRWTVEDTGYIIYDSVVSVEAIGDLPVGYLEDVYQIQQSSTADGIEIYDTYKVIWFAPGVGMVKLYVWNGEPTITPDETWRLIEYNAK